MSAHVRHGEKCAPSGETAPAVGAVERHLLGADDRLVAARAGAP